MAIQFKGGNILFFGGDMAFGANCCDCVACGDCEDGAAAPCYEASVVIDSVFDDVYLLTQDGTDDCCWEEDDPVVDVLLTFASGQWRAGIDQNDRLFCGNAADLETGTFTCENGGFFSGTDRFGQFLEITVTPNWGCSL